MTIEALVASSPLRMGATGDAVRQVQLALKQAGYSLTGTGWFGPATDTAVETFQRRAGLVVDGQVGPKTAAALDLAAAGKAPPAPATAQEISRPLWLEAGIKLIGTKEGAGAKDNPSIIQWAKDEGGDIAAEYTHDSIPWCALFANHCLTKVGLKGTGTLWALDFAGHWPAVKLAGPAVGAFAPMKRTGGGHIMMIVGRDQHGNVMGLGGNQSDAVNIEPFAVSRLNQGFWWPSSVPMPPASQIGIGHLPFVQSNGKVSVNEA
ncbi:uncharacterized protein (TIGR02594 family) [Bradyrhizobium japonicum]|uniref:NlpC/P60 family protein n=1 Tax=Bradyrhizobium TaxID=374 RepID=UPI0003F8D6AC|nr:MULTISPECIES: TIGR02594 family protein [Bradyrhizobium]MBR1004547.1 TIGR02594 family protein [Bradyrhizobium liaoningense]MCP1741698.1 uncharacterized protein (TIGR02594 family) [Bradyrhizobium japonicum]MCP1779479.1 uncharacterized protein (TIGR02594 family) [Bradyrhizobium japonicum]MCP1859408.1 uncharacterized protein (TIGR02594 family) [Bradyrhizobium japonicum]MCP1890175.1 uncharacterized protein (TIGR02594 family) [Bradyrhizobium japonicum]